MDWRRFLRALCIAVAVVVGGFDVALYGARALNPDIAPYLGGDLTLYQDAARRWLVGGGFYLPYQLAGPYLVTTDQILYPPMALLLFVPSLVLPRILWWLIPLGITTAIVFHWRPAPWAWLIIALCLAQAGSFGAISAGNPAMWIGAALAVATVWRPAAALVVLKPSLAPLALFGLRDRRWWLMAGALAAVSLALLPMDVDWLRAIVNARGERSGLLYSLGDVPFVAVPLVAWLGRSLSSRGMPRPP